MSKPFIQTLLLEIPRTDDRSLPDRIEKIVCDAKQSLEKYPAEQRFELKIDETDQPFDEKIAECLIEQVKKWGLTCPVRLPIGWENSPVQRLLDEVVSDNFYAQSVAPSAPIPSAVRTRPHLSNGSSYGVDIELEQAQQVEIQVEAAVALASGREEKEYEDTSEVYDLARFKAEIPGFIAYENAEALWTNWFGELTGNLWDFTGKRQIKVSKSACEELFAHYEKFQYGLDFDQLPTGFFLKPDEAIFSSAVVLSFDPRKKIAAVEKPYPLAIQTTFAKKNDTVSHKHFMAFLAFRSEECPIVQKWKELSQSAFYDSETHRVFKAYVPQMLGLVHVGVSRDLLSLILDMCFDGPRCHVSLFRFLLDKALANKVSDAALEKVLVAQLPDTEKRARLSELLGSQGRSSYLNVLHGPLQSALKRMLPDDDVRIAELIQKGAGTAKLQALLGVYLRYGAEGVQRFWELNDRDREGFEKIHPALLSDTKKYTGLFDPQFQLALDQIKGMSAEEATWWNTLLKQHCAVQTEVDVTDLLHAFLHFRDELKKIQTDTGECLSFPETCGIQGSKSLPVTLSRILRVLRHVSPENRQEQWKAIQGLNFCSSGVIQLVCAGSVGEKYGIKPDFDVRVVQDPPSASIARKMKWGFFTSEMWIEQREAQDVWRASTAEMSPAQAFFQDAARTEDGQSMPLSFYRYAHEQVECLCEEEKLDEALKRTLYKVLEKSTQGTNRKLIRSSEAATEQVNSFLTSMKTIIKKLSDHRALIRAVAPNFEVPNLFSPLSRSAGRYPPLQFVAAYVQIVASLAQELSILGLGSLIWGQKKALVRKLEIINAELPNFSRIYDDAFFVGFTHYPNEEFSGGLKAVDLILRHFEVVSKVRDAFPHPDPIMRKEIIRLISLFNLQAETLQKDFEFLGSVRSTSYSKVVSLLDLLAKIPAHDALPRLQSTDLAHICREVLAEGINDETLLSRVQGCVLPSCNKPLKDYFPEHVFFAEAFQKGTAISRLLADTFSQPEITQIEAFFSLFKHTEERSYAEHIQCLVACVEHVLPADKNRFIELVTQSPGLRSYAADNFLNNLENPILALLQFLKKNPSKVSQLMYLLSQEPPQDSGMVVHDLGKKLLDYFTIIQPKLAQSAFALPQSVWLPRLTAFFFKGPAKADIRGSRLVFEKTEALDKGIALLAEFENQLEKGEGVDSIVENLIVYTEQSGEKTIQPEILKTLTGQIQAWQTPRVHNVQAGLQAVIADTKDEERKKSLNFLAAHPFLLQHFSRVLSEEKSEVAPDPVKPDGRREFSFALFDFFKPKKAASTQSSLVSVRAANWEKALDKDLAAYKVFLGTVQEHCQALLQAKIAALQCSYSDWCVEFIRNLDRLAEKNTFAKHAVFALFDRYLHDYSPEKDGDFLQYLEQFIAQLESGFACIEDKLLVLNLCVTFNESAVIEEKAAPSEFSPQRLLEFCKKLQELADPEDRVVALKIVKNSLNKQGVYSQGKIDAFIDGMNTQPAFRAFVQWLAQENALLPDMGQILAWKAQSAGQDDPLAFLKGTHTAFDKNPTGKPRDGKNGFDPEKAKTQLQLTQSDSQPLPVDAASIAELETQIAFVKGQTCEELRRILQAQKNAAVMNYELLVSAAAELLYRAQGQEINTTQYLAILIALKTAGHVTSQIATGEGKSRIMMISVACQHALGKTVDFLTSNLQLATRDFLEYQPYFDLLGVKTSLIAADSDFQAYLHDGVNFSDASNLSLFRNQARFYGKLSAVYGEAESERVLFLDEADSMYFDMGDMRFNFSQVADETLRHMDWIYPLLMDYFRTEGKDVLYYADMDKSREDFLSFANNKNPEKSIFLKKLSPEQIEQWQDSAMQAKQLQFGKDYVIESPVAVQTPHGILMGSEARLLSGGRVSRNAKFSFGVHQCLHAELNYYKAHVDRVDSVLLRDALSACKEDFWVLPEKQIVCSSTAKNLLDDYQKGAIKAVTGTGGSRSERKEARALYGMQFVDIPREHATQRVDRAIRLTRDSAQQVQALLEQIKLARRKKQPILIIAEDEKESQALFKTLQSHLPADERLQLIDSKLSYEAEKTCIGKAGEAGWVTVSTDMIGRGTDIKVAEEGQAHGLRVLTTHVPRERDLAQILGRSGRFGQKGETVLVLDKARLKKEWGKLTLTDGFYGDREAYVQRIQELQDRKKQRERLIKQAVGDFRRALEDSFFTAYHKLESQALRTTGLGEWTVFVGKMDKIWSAQWGEIQTHIHALDITQINRLLAAYRQAVLKQKATLLDSVLPGIPIPQVACALLPKNIELFTAPMGAGGSRVYDRYDAGHEGRAVRYSGWLVPIGAWIKGYLNLLPFMHFSEYRRPFANFRAWLEGHGRLFPDLRYFIHTVVAAISSWWSKKSQGMPDPVLLQEEKVEQPDAKQPDAAAQSDATPNSLLGSPSSEPIPMQLRKQQSRVDEAKPDPDSASPRRPSS